MALIKEEGLVVVYDLDYIRHLVCDQCNLCAKDCRYNCRFVRENLEKIRSLHLDRQGICLALWEKTETYIRHE